MKRLLQVLLVACLVVPILGVAFGWIDAPTFHPIGEPIPQTYRRGGTPLAGSWPTQEELDAEMRRMKNPNYRTPIGPLDSALVVYPPSVSRVNPDYRTPALPDSERIALLEAEVQRAHGRLDRHEGWITILWGARR